MILSSPIQTILKYLINTYLCTCVLLSFHLSNFSAHPWFKLAIKTSYTDLLILWPTAILSTYCKSSLEFIFATDNSNFSVENKMAEEVMSALGNYRMCEIVTHPTALQHWAPICAPGHEFKRNQLIRVACFSPVQFRNRESRRIWFLSRLCLFLFYFSSCCFPFFSPVQIQVNNWSPIWWPVCLILNWHRYTNEI